MKLKNINIQSSLDCLDSLSPMRELWSGYLGPQFTHIFGHNDGRVSFVPDSAYARAVPMCPVSSFRKITHLCPENIREILFPSARNGGLVHIRITEHVKVSPQGISTSIRLGVDLVNEVWIICSDPVVTTASTRLVATSHNMSPKVQLDITTEDFVAAVNIAKSIV